MKRNRSKAKEGYERLAFGGVADAIRLLYGEQPDREELLQMDFYNISEIKRPKDGAMEIRFFDRLCALEKLEALEKANKEEAPLFRAVEEGARALAQNTLHGSEEAK